MKTKVMTTATTVTLPVALKVAAGEYLEHQTIETRQTWSFSRLVAEALEEYLNGRAVMKHSKKIAARS